MFQINIFWSRSAVASTILSGDQANATIDVPTLEFGDRKGVLINEPQVSASAGVFGLCRRALPYSSWPSTITNFSKVSTPVDLMRLKSVTQLDPPTTAKLPLGLKLQLWCMCVRVRGRACACACVYFFCSLTCPACTNLRLGAHTRPQVRPGNFASLTETFIPYL